MVLYASGGEELSYHAQEWNKLLELWGTLSERYGLTDPGGKIAQAVQTGETDYYEPDKPNALIEAGVSIKLAIKEAFEPKKRDPRDAATLDWDEMIGFLQGLDPDGSFIGFQAQEGELTGGHGRGWMWSLWNATSTLATGAVPAPNNTHGRTQGALNGSRGTVASAVAGLNSTIEAVVDGIEWPLGLGT